MKPAAPIAAGRLMILEIDVQGAIQIKQQLPQAFALFVLPPVYLLIATGESRESAPTDLDARIARREVA